MCCESTTVFPFELKKRADKKAGACGSCCSADKAEAHAAEEVKELYNDLNVWGMETTVDVRDCNPETMRDAEAIKKYVVELCKLIDMKRFGPTTVVHFGEDEKVAGFSMTQLIETSLISAHFANNTNTSYINIFSCKFYDPFVVARFTMDFFGGKKCDGNIVMRK